jgi:hypothetical protein
MRDPMRTMLLLVSSLLCLPLAGCQRSLDAHDVREFIDLADAAARKRYAPEICELRGQNFKLHQVFQGHEERVGPTELEIDRKLYCKKLSAFSRIRQYLLVRKSIEIELAADRKTARVVADYVETLPYYEEWTTPATPDDFRKFQVLVTRDVSVVGIEDGDLVFLRTDSNISQSLIGKNSIDLPYD